jgi:large subunit ribosomal protein L19e
MKNLDKRKYLASKVLGVGKGRIVFDPSRLAEIKDAITKQDIKDLFAEGIIYIREKKGRRLHVKRTTKRGMGKIKLRVAHNKQDYTLLVRKFRGYLEDLRKNGKLTEENFWQLRNKIKAGVFDTKAHFREYLAGIGVK